VLFSDVLRFGNICFDWPVLTPLIQRQMAGTTLMPRIPANGRSHDEKSTTFRRWLDAMCPLLSRPRHCCNGSSIKDVRSEGKGGVGSDADKGEGFDFMRTYATQYRTKACPVLLAWSCPAFLVTPVTAVHGCSKRTAQVAWRCESVHGLLNW